MVEQHIVHFSNIHIFFALSYGPESYVGVRKILRQSLTLPSLNQYLI